MLHVNRMQMPANNAGFTVDDDKNIADGHTRTTVLLALPTERKQRNLKACLG